MLSRFCDWDVEDIASCAKAPAERHKLEPVIDALACYIQKSIKARKIRLPRARIRVIQDGISKKIRPIAIASIMQQIYDYIAKEGLQELFNAKFAPHQCATIRGRGQNYGKKIIEKWMHEKQQVRRDGKQISGKPVSTCAFEADVRKCYPSMSIGRLKAYLHRDVRNPELLWLVDYLIDKMTREKYNLRKERLRGKNLVFASRQGLRAQRVKRGLSIGSVLSCNLCNYMMSYAWRYLQNACRWEMRRGKDGKPQHVRVRLITHCLIYMDNLTVLGKNKRDLMRAEAMLERYMRGELGMQIKRDWRLYRLDYAGKDSKRHGSPVDSMGFVVYRDRVFMRGKIFLRARRKFTRLRKKRAHKQQPSKRLCGSIIAYNGWFSNINARRWQQRNDFKYHIVMTARKKMGQYMREENMRVRQSTIQRAAVVC